MAFLPKLSSCLTTGCTLMNINDTRGLYNATTNPNGWDAGSTVNIAKADVTSATLEITGPTQTSATTIDVTAAITSSSIYVEEFLLVQLASSDLNLGSTFTDGRYTYTYTITDSSGDEYVKNGSFIHLCNAKCCLASAMKEFTLTSFCDCCSDVDRMKALQLADTLIKGMEEAECGLTTTQITQNLASINRICGNLKSGCCN
jgi:hypothetical protein